MCHFQLNFLPATNQCHDGMQVLLVALALLISIYPKNLYKMTWESQTCNSGMTNMAYMRLKKKSLERWHGRQCA